MAMPAVKTTSELYPPRAAPEVSALVKTIVTFRPSSSDLPVELARALSVPEREALSARAGVVARWLRPGRQAEIARSVSGMLLGFGRSMSVEEAMEVAAQWAHTLRDLPEWAVERACMRFARGEVRAAELGVERLDVGFAPSTAQLHRVAAAISADLENERQKIDEVLRGTASLGAPAPARRANAAVGAKLTEHLRMKAEARDAEQVERQLRIEAESDQRRREEFARAERTYRDAGLEPPVWKPGDVPVTLQMKLRFGWTTEEVEGRRTLLSPA